MRLTCPNCDAVYEVPVGTIPPEGRDVQCSNCGRTWFQPDPDRAPADADGLDEFAEAEAAVSVEDAAPDGPVAEEVAAEPEAHGATEAPGGDAFEDADDETERELPRHEPDPEAIRILREEAEREARLRAEARARRAAAATGAVEDPRAPDVEATPAAAETVEIIEPEPKAEAETPTEADNAQSDREMAELIAEILPPDRTDAGEVEDAEVVAGAAPSRRTGADEDPSQSRMNSFPDVDEVSGTLKEPPPPDPNGAIAARAKAAKRRAEFRRGFAIAIIAVGLMVGVYIFSAEIAASVPALAGPLATYADWVDGLRVSLDAFARSAIGADV